MAGKSFYITTTLPYVNAKPHIGFALEIVQADVIARYKRLTGHEVFFNFGTDEHGQKIYQKAQEAGKDPQAYVDEYAKKFDALKKALNLSYNNFIRTTDPHHVAAAQEIWTICKDNEFIEKGIYKAKYCVGCELEKTDSELEDGKCSLHPNREIQLIEEENYFFKFSQFRQKLLELYDKNPKFVVPKHRLTEIRNFVEGGLNDFSISRLKEKMPWGVPVPEDNKHVMYVWFDALTNYISALGWPEDKEKFTKFWGTSKSPKAIQVAGKDNLRQQSAMWQAMLMAANLPLTKQILIHGFITSDGAKMSKSLGNVVDPIEVVKKYSTDITRYYLLREIPTTKDGDFSFRRLEQLYSADLANGLGNLVSRVTGLASKSIVTRPRPSRDEVGNCQLSKVESFSKEVAKSIETYEFDKALAYIWNEIKKADIFINKRAVWNLKGKQKEAALNNLVNRVKQIAIDLKPFLPETSERIEKQFEGSKIKPARSLFPRLK